MLAPAFYTPLPPEGEGAYLQFLAQWVLALQKVEEKANRCCSGAATEMRTVSPKVKNQSSHYARRICQRATPPFCSPTFRLPGFNSVRHLRVGCFFKLAYLPRAAPQI